MIVTPIFKRCSECGKKIKLRPPKNIILRLELEETEGAVCNECDPKSRWARVYPAIKGKGQIEDWKYEEIETSLGKGLGLCGPNGRKLYLAPEASKERLNAQLKALPSYVRERLTEYPLVKKLKNKD